MTTQAEKDRKTAEKLWRKLVGCMNGDTKHAYTPGNERCHEEMHILSALRAERNRTIDQCVAIARNIKETSSKKEEAIYSLGRAWGAERIEMEILGLKESLK